MKDNEIISREFPTALIIASFVIILAGVVLAQSIINPLLMGLFLSIISTQPVLWLNKRKVPIGIAVLIVLLFEVTFFIALSEIIGSSVSSFSNDSAIYEAKLEKMWLSLIAVLNGYGIQFS